MVKTDAKYVNFATFEGSPTIMMTASVYWQLIYNWCFFSQTSRFWF